MSDEKSLEEMLRGLGQESSIESDCKAFGLVVKGFKCMKAGDIKGAVKHFQELDTLDPASKYKALGEYYKCQRIDHMHIIEHEEANFRKALELRPDDPYLHLSVGDALLDRGDLTMAEVYFEQALELNPELSLAHYHLGECYFRKEEFEEAKEAYQKALELSPDCIIFQQLIQKRMGELEKHKAEKTKTYSGTEIPPESPIRGYPVTREEHIRDISSLDASPEEKSRRFADDMPPYLE